MWKAARVGKQLLSNALRESFLNADAALRIHQERGAGADTSGCTALCCMITPTMIVCVPMLEIHVRSL